MPLLTFDFDLIIGSFFTFWGLNGLFLGSNHVVEQLSFSMIPLILTFEFDLIFWVESKIVFELYPDPENSQWGPKKVKKNDPIIK